MSKLKLLSLVCHVTDDSKEADDALFDVTVEDEPILYVNHKIVWRGSRMGPNDIADLSGVDVIDFKNTAIVSLWDEDAGYFDNESDEIGTFSIQEFQAGSGELTHKFKGKVARYTLKFKIV